MRLIFTILALWAFSLSAAAPQSGTLLQTQSPTALIADRITYDRARDMLIASGNVEVIYEGRVLRAVEIRFNNATGTIDATGPLTLLEEGMAPISAEALTLDTTLQTGLVQGARLVLAQNFQIAAAEARILENGQSALYKTVASACVICDTGDVPLWLMRAERVLRDEEARAIYFRNVRFEFFGATIGYLPYFSIADPSVKRATGFLNPNFASNDYFGYGLKTPYYIVIAQDKDLTITPFFTSIGGTLMEFEYRQKFAKGEMELGGHFSLSNALDSGDSLRGSFYANAEYALPRGFELSISAQNASDKGFLRQYDYTTADRLRSQIGVSRQIENEYIDGSFVGYQTLRDGEDNATIPNLFPNLGYQRYWDDAGLGGRLSLGGGLTSLMRSSGRDVLEIGADALWEKSAPIGPGLTFKSTIGAEAQLFGIRDDGNFPDATQSVVTGYAATELRWPWMRSRARTTEVIEPVIQAVVSRRYGDQNTIPNEDSVTLEFDATNLFALNRFPGNDLAEEGLRFNLGAEYTRISQTGLSMTAALGQVFRSKPANSFPQNTGLNNKRSNIVAAMTLDVPGAFQLSNQSLFDNDFVFSRNDVQAEIEWRDLGLDLSYVFLAADPVALTDEQHEFLVTSRYQINENWALGASMRRNLAEGENVNASGSLRYRNECIDAEFSVSRRFTNSSTLPPGTDFGLTVKLAGFGGSGIEFPAQSCVRYKN